MTLVDQLLALRPLTQGAVGSLAGHTNPKSMSTKRRRGSRLSDEQLRVVAHRLRELAARADAMAGSAGPSS